MADDQTVGVRDSRPAIFIGGKEEPELSGGLLSLTIVENNSGLYRCESIFGNWGNKDNKIGFLYFDRRRLDFGKDFQVKLKDGAIFEGRIMGLEAGFPEGQSPQITVLAEDRFQDLRMTRRTRSFFDVSDADVFNQIASEHGLIPSVDLTGPTYKTLAQVNQSDLAFLRERARTIDAELWMEGRTLNARTRSKRNGGKLQLEHGGQLREFTVLADLAMQRTSVTVGGWDVSDKSELKYEATESAVSSELNGDQSGISILKSAFGERRESLAHTIPLNSQEAQSAAEAFLRMSARRFLTGRGVAETGVGLRVGAYVELKGLGPLFSGKYYLTEVKHVFDGKKGLRTAFRAERPGIGKGGN
jgi:Bacteriophage probable baseplate hub protein